MHWDLSENVYFICLFQQWYLFEFLFFLHKDHKVELSFDFEMIQ